MNKNKLKNIALGVSLGLNILLGFFLGGGLISSCTAKKVENPVSSVSNDASGQIIDGMQKRALMPRLAADDDLDPEDYPNQWESSGLNYTFSTGHALYATETAGVFGYTPQANGRIEFNKINVAGLYYGAFSHSANTWGGAFFMDRTNYTTLMQADISAGGRAYYIAEIQATGSYFYVTQAQVASGAYVGFSQNGGFTPFIYLISGSDITPKFNIDLGAEWLPLAWFSNKASGNYALFTSSLDDPQNTEWRLGFDGLYFSTLNDSRTFNALRVSYRPLWNGARYEYDGEILAYSFGNDAEFRLVVLTRVEYRDAESGNWFSVADSNLNMLNPNSPVFTGRVSWVNAGYRTLRFWQTPKTDLVAPTIQEVTYDAGVTWGNWGRAPFRYGLDFFSWLGLRPYSYVETTAGIGDAFTLLGGAFSAVGGILNIQILPFLTLGTLIFVPLVVLIILAILRLLAK